MKNKYYFYRLPAELLEQHGPTVAAVYSVLLNGCTEGIFRTDMKIEVLAQKCGMKKRQVITVINQLEELGLVRRVKDGRRTVYDVIPILPPKQHGKEYVPEPGKFANETYEDLLLRIPNREWRERLKEQLLLAGFSLKSTAYFGLRNIDNEAELKRNGANWYDHMESMRLGDQINEANLGGFVPLKKKGEDDGENK